MIKVISVNLTIKKMLKCFGQKNITVGSLSFSKQQPDIEERRKLRYKLIEKIKQHKDFQKHQKSFKEAQLLNIGGKPKGSIVALSISHTRSIGVFLFTFDKSLSIGFDIENKNRVTKKVIERVSSKEELSQAPEVSLLWTAKEAGFKSLSAKTGALFLSDCLISQWTKEKEFYKFQCYSKKTEQIAMGIAGFKDHLVIAYTESSMNPVSSKTAKRKHEKTEIH